jgi:hypothetical protein
MCTVSNIGTAAGDYIPGRYPYVQPWVNPGAAGVPQAPFVDSVTRAEFEALRNEMAELRKLLVAAKEYDRATGQPDCEVDEKVALLKRLAELVDVDLDDVLAV